jgi:hypothetical protein
MSSASKDQTAGDLNLPSLTLSRVKSLFQTNLTPAGIFWHLYALFLTIVAAGIWKYFR